MGIAMQRFWRAAVMAVFWGLSLAGSWAGETQGLQPDGLKPGDAKAHLRLGQALAGRGQLEEAIQEYREALRLKPDAPAVHFNLARAYEAKGLKAEAIRAWEAYLKLAEGLPSEQGRVSIARERLKQLTKESRGG